MYGEDHERSVLHTKNRNRRKGIAADTNKTHELRVENCVGTCKSHENYMGEYRVDVPA